MVSVLRPERKLRRLLGPSKQEHLRALVEARLVLEHQDERDDHANAYECAKLGDLVDGAEANHSVHERRPLEENVKLCHHLHVGAPQKENHQEHLRSEFGG